MLLNYINAAMDRAQYEILPDNEGFYGEVPELRGVWADASTLEDCRRELQEAVESWILAKLRHGDSDFPVLAGIDLNKSSSDDPAISGAVA
jgi:predicted RNase H-like HicB family nuclease